MLPSRSALWTSSVILVHDSLTSSSPTTVHIYHLLLLLIKVIRQIANKYQCVTVCKGGFYFKFTWVEWNQVCRGNCTNNKFWVTYCSMNFKVRMKGWIVTPKDNLLTPQIFFRVKFWRNISLTQLYKFWRFVMVNSSDDIDLCTNIAFTLQSGASVLFLMLTVVNYEPLVVFQWHIPTKFHGDLSTVSK